MANSSFHRSESSKNKSIHDGLASLCISSRTPTQVTSVGFRGIPTLVRELWPKLRQVGGRDFEPYDNEEHRRLVIKIMLYLCEAKIAFAHRNELAPAHGHSQSFVYLSETTTLESLALAATQLPKPLAIAVETFGFCNIGDEEIFPIVDNVAESGINTFSPRTLGEHLAELTAWRSAEELKLKTQMFAAIRKLDPEFKWEIKLGEPKILYQVSTEFAAQWEFPEVSSEDIATFCKIMQTQAQRIGWLINCNLKSGLGSPAQVVQFRDKDLHEDVRLYSVVKVTDEDLALAAAIRHGDTDSPPATRYTVGSYNTALLKASADCFGARNAIMRLSNI